MQNEGFPGRSVGKESACNTGDPSSIPGFGRSQYQVYDPTSNAEEAKVEQIFEDLQDFLEVTPKKDILFVIGDWNAEVGSQEISRITGKFGLVLQNEAGQS